MATEVTMPKMGYDMEEGTILSWLVAEGDEVARGAILGEIETGKVNIEIEAFDAGVLLKILVPEGDTVPVGAAIAVIGEAGEEYTPVAAPAASAAGTSNGAAGQDSPQVSTAAETQPGAQAGGSAAVSDQTIVRADGGRLRASPLARRIASENGVDLSAIAGSGPNGRIIRDDVQTAVDAGPLAAPSLAPSLAPVAGVPVPTGPDSERESLSRIRTTIATRLSESWQAAPHIFVTMAIELDDALALRKEINASLEATGGGKVSVNDLVVKAAARALRQHPLMNVSWDDGMRVRHSRVNVGIAVALDDGLMTVTVPDSDVKSLSTVSAEIADKATRAREGKLHADDLSTPSTFTVSNLGMYGVEHFTAILNPPEAGILAVGAGAKTVVVRDGEIVARTMMNVTLSADHRVVDGATAAEFLVTLKNTLENPLSLVI